MLLNGSLDATLTTERLVLRPIQRSDAGLIQLYASEERLARMTTSIPHPLPPGAAEAFVAKSLQPENAERVWAITPKDDVRDGLVGLISIEPTETPGEAELGYWVGAPFRDAGFATEAVSALVPHVLSLGFAQVVAQVFQDNPSSPKVLTKAGFSHVGAGEAFSVARGANVAQWCYRIERAAWQPST